MTEENLIALQEVLEQWDMGWIRAVSVVNIPTVTRAMMRLRDVITEERIALINAADGQRQLKEKHNV